MGALVPEWTHRLLLAVVAGGLLRNAGTAPTPARRRHLAGALPTAPVLLAADSLGCRHRCGLLVLR
ncbi:hypothetical protein [Streptomyces mutomycini]|uniref:hypothetical protein n=1 Tax=Streptomyces mutomycini TaxID=284036 RepID=UPI000818C8C0|nr:hypothetical protein [Streptomyces mutomycini]